jgi:NAD(P)-dependent dehydrogenase (short-subunit alcohol dehydrogenase family)
MGYSLEDKNVLVTGGSSGIGAALAVGFARAGATVGICARRAERLEEVLERVRAHAPDSRSWIVDLSDLDGIESFARRVENDLGGVDVLVNNAGIPKRRRVPDLTPDVVESVMRINYFSPIRLTLALLPGIEKRNGRVVNISSVAARLGPPAEAAYAASKAAVTAWSESMQVDLGIAGSAVKVHVVNPGVFDTELFHLPDNDAFTAPVEMLPVESIVDPILAAIQSETFEIYVPEWFGDIASARYKDLGGFIEGTKLFVRSLHDDKPGPSVAAP